MNDVYQDYQKRLAEWRVARMNHWSRVFAGCIGGDLGYGYGIDRANQALGAFDAQFPQPKMPKGGES